MQENKKEKKIKNPFFAKERNNKLNSQKHKNAKVISGIIAIIVIIVLIAIYAINNLTRVQEKTVSGKIEEVNALPGQYSIYGVTPFTEEYSVGSFCQATGVAFGTGFAHTGTQANGNYRMIGTNTSKDSNVYRDAIGGFKMGTEVYDVRTYFWLIEGDDYAVWGSYAYGAYSKTQSQEDKFTDGYVSKSVNTVIGLEMHFYESGTLETSRPKEVAVKGIGCFTDNDDGEGYEFMNGVNGVWLTRDTTIKVGTAISDQLYQTWWGNAWIGTATADSLDSQKIYYQFDSSPSSPLTVRHYGLSGYHSGVYSEVHNVTYHVIGTVPAGVTYPTDPIYVADYGTYTIMNSLSASGYTFTGWNQNSINGTNVSGKKMSPITSNIDVYGQFTKNTMNIPVKKVWNDSNNQDGKRPSSVTVTLYSGNTSTGKTLVLNNSNNWSGTFTGVDEATNYTVKENTVSGYTSSVTGNATSGFTITNSYTPQTMNITVSKTWNDNNNQDGKRPPSVKVTLYANGISTGKSLTMSNLTAWKGIFSNVAKYSEGKAITYTIQETAVSGYNTSITGNSTNGFTVINTHTPETTSITVKKVWNHTNNIYKIPGEVKIQVKNGTTVVAEKVLNSTNKSNNDNIWSWTFTNLPKYQNQGQEINYTIDEAEVNSGDLKYYQKQISGTTITNTYNGPIIDASKELKTEHGLGYVVEGEKITYTIRVKNSGGQAQDVLVKDNIPEGTTFVTGSIKVNGTAQQNKTAQDLSNGITLNVPAKQGSTSGETTVSFEVTVNTLGANIFTKTITNQATVNKNPGSSGSQDELINAVTTTVNKANLKYNKTSSPASGSTVKAGDEIIYTIHLDNKEGKAPTVATVKDNIPTGTTFVTGSIKIGGQEDSTKTADDLKNGITVNLGAGESKDIEFKVKVNDLDNGATIKNVATVNNNTTNETNHKYVEPIITASKEMKTENGLGYVVEGEKITYTIRVQNSGDLAQDVIVKDNIPEGTTFVAGSIKVNGESNYNIDDEDINLSEKTAKDLASGLKVNVPAKQDSTLGETTISFEVTVNTLEEGTFTKVITNQATVNKNPEKQDSPDDPTNEVTTTLNKADLKYSKTSNPASGSTVKEGDEITYTIHLDNTSGKAPTNTVVKDNIPTGTTFVTGSIKIGGQEDSTKTADDLKNGITVNLGAGESKDIEFKVKVNDLDNGATIKNVATVNNNTTNETNHKYVEPIITASKEMKTENGLGYVVEGEKITYTIRIQNSGDKEKDVIVKDNVPEGTTFASGSIKVNEESNYNINDEDIDLSEKTAQDLSNGITVNVPARTDSNTPGEVTVSFEVTVDYDTKEKTIKNIGTVDGTDTNEVEIPYEVPQLDLQSSIVKDGTQKITSADEKINYTINYKANIKEFIGKGKLKIVDYLPYEIDKENSEIDGGTYNKDEKTITWEENLGNIDTYSNENGIIEIERTKTLTLKYLYTDADNLEGTIENNAKGTITLIQEQENTEDPDEPTIEDVVVKEETVEDNHEVNVEIPVRLIVHHYLEGTTDIVPGSEDAQIDEERTRGTEYTTSALENLDPKYELVEEPSNSSGILTKKETIVTYYYRVKDSAGVIVHHIDTDTKQKIAPDVKIPANRNRKIRRQLHNRSK